MKKVVKKILIRSLGRIQTMRNHIGEERDSNLFSIEIFLIKITRLACS